MAVISKEGKIPKIIINRTEPVQIVTGWNNNEKIVFRFFFSFFLLLSVPLYDFRFYITLFSGEWDLEHWMQLLRYIPQFVSRDTLPQFGPASFINWGIAAIISAVSAAIWTRYDKRSTEYRQLYYMLRVIVRYRLALALIPYGIIKLMPLQMPFPSLSNLYTHYGDFYAWKIYFHTLGISSWYESFLGAVEIIAGLLILNRKTATIGAGIVLGFIGNVMMANFAYQIGEHVFSTFLIFLAAFIFAQDAQRLYHLIILRKIALAGRFEPYFRGNWFPVSRRSAQVLFLLFLIFFSVKAFTYYVNISSDQVTTGSLKNAYGFYNVREFILNNDTIPYSVTDARRWQNVVFEKWPSLSIQIDDAVLIDDSNGDVILRNRNGLQEYSIAGNAGRHYFNYETDTISNSITIEPDKQGVREQRFSLKYSWQNDSTIVLSGKDNKHQQITAVLERVNAKHILLAGRRKSIKL